MQVRVEKGGDWLQLLYPKTGEEAVAVAALAAVGVAFLVLAGAAMGGKLVSRLAGRLRGRHRGRAVNDPSVRMCLAALCDWPPVDTQRRSIADLRAMAEETRAMNDAAKGLDDEVASADFEKLRPLLEDAIAYWPVFEWKYLAIRKHGTWLISTQFAVCDKVILRDSFTHSRIKRLLRDWPQIAAYAEKQIQSDHAAATARLDEVMATDKPIKQRRAAALSAFLVPEKNGREKDGRLKVKCGTCGKRFLTRPGFFTKAVCQDCLLYGAE